MGNEKEEKKLVKNKKQKEYVYTEEVRVSFLRNPV